MGDLKKRVYSQQEVATYIGTSSSTIGRMVAKGEFPKSVKITKGRTGWFIEEVDQWLDEKKAESRAARKENEAA